MDLYVEGCLSILYPRSLLLRAYLHLLKLPANTADSVPEQLMMNAKYESVSIWSLLVCGPWSLLEVTRHQLMTEIRRGKTSTSVKWFSSSEAASGWLRHASDVWQCCAILSHYYLSPTVCKTFTVKHFGWHILKAANLPLFRLRHFAHMCLDRFLMW